MSHYLDDPELTAKAIVDGWLVTGDLGRFGRQWTLATFWPQEKHDRHRRRQEYLSEDIETAFEGLPVKEYCIFAANYLWPAKTLGREMLVLLLRLEQNQEFSDA